ncbi:MAG: SUMF1/EgtB/PvdO family nonheme iron enzyme, partial [Planctomycetaceae bacterium]|nr:SUMF1/EgtB/PvdO family nonheme iron enzyme [Planctomycetaceae bacterium]
MRLRELLPNTDIIHPELPADDDQKRIAQWVLSEGGVFDVWRVGPVKAPPIQSFAAAYTAFIDPATSPDGSEANQLAGLKALQTLRWDFLKNADIAMKTICTLDSLVQLEISGSDISTTGMKQVGKLKQIELLFLNLCKSLDDEGVSHLTELKHIYHLQLSSTPISNTGLLHLGEIPSLQRLYLNECQRISDEGIQHLVSLPRLKYLDLSGTPLTDACIPQLSQTQSLRILLIDRTKITAEGAAKLQAALPKCVVFHESLKDTPWRLPESEVPAVATAPFNAEQAKAHQEAWARYLGKPIEFDNSLELEFSLIPPGQFVMGSPENEEGRFTDENQVPVTITAPFWMSKTEVTQQIWQKVMKTTPWTGDEHVISESHNPVTNVSWNDAVEFCQKFTQLERESGKLADGLVYRLPTEAEWEYACRSGSQTAFTYGNDISQLGDYAWWGGVSGGSASNQRYAHAVALKKPNAWGLYDMHGNVFEWCEDHYALQLTGGADPIVRLEEGNRVARS